VAETRKKVLVNGRPVDGADVPVVESIERWSEIKLEDGTILRVKLTVTAVGRADSEYDDKGNPMYSIDMVPQVSIIDVPDRLKRKTN
jgi:hypothetical protein